MASRREVAEMTSRRRAIEATADTVRNGRANSKQKKAIKLALDAGVVTLTELRQREQMERDQLHLDFDGV